MATAKGSAKGAGSKSPTAKGSAKAPAPVAMNAPPTADAKAGEGTKFVRLNDHYLFNGQRYGPGRKVEVPASFPDLHPDGQVVYPAGSTAALNQARSARENGTPAPLMQAGGAKSRGTQGRPEPIVDLPEIELHRAAGEEELDGVSREDLESMELDELRTLAYEAKIPVEGADGAEPTKTDFVSALAPIEG